MTTRPTFQVSGLNKQPLTLNTTGLAPRPSATRISIGGETRRGYGTSTYTPTGKPILGTLPGLNNARYTSTTAPQTTYYSGTRISQTARPSLTSTLGTSSGATYQTSGSARKLVSPTAIPISISTVSGARALERLSNQGKPSGVEAPASIVKIAGSPYTDKSVLSAAPLAETHSIYSPRIVSNPSGTRQVEVTYDENGERRPASVHRLTVESIPAKPSEAVVITSRSGSAQPNARGFSEPPASTFSHQALNRVSMEVSTTGADSVRQPLSFGRYLNATAGIGIEPTGSLTDRGTGDTRVLYNRDTLDLDNGRATEGNNSFRATLQSLQHQPWTQRHTHDTFIREVRGGSALPPHINLSAPRAPAGQGLLTDRETGPFRPTNPSAEMEEHARQTGLTDQIRRELRRLGLEAQIGALMRRVNASAVTNYLPTNAQHSDAILRDRVADLEEKVRQKRERYFALLEVGRLSCRMKQLCRNKNCLLSKHSARVFGAT